MSIVNQVRARHSSVLMKLNINFIKNWQLERLENVRNQLTLSSSVNFLTSRWRSLNVKFHTKFTCKTLSEILMHEMRIMRAKAFLSRLLMENSTAPR